MLPVDLLFNRFRGHIRGLLDKHAHGDLTGITADQHHARQHAINAAADHTGTLDDEQIPAGIARDSEVTAAVGAHEGAADPHPTYQTPAEHTAVGNAAPHHAASHVLATGTALGPDHTVSGAAAGEVLRALSATTAAFDVLQHADLGGVTAAQHPVEDGTSSAPGIAFTSDPDLGWYRIGPDHAGFAGSLAFRGPRPWVDVRAFGAVGDGVVDDSAAVQAAIDAATVAGGIVFCPPGTYRLGTTLNLLSNVVLRGAGSASALDASTTTKIGTARIAVRALGSLGSAIALSADATKGTYSVTVTSASGLAEGDWVMVRTEGANYYPYSGATVDRGELKRIRTIAATTLTFEQALYDNYTVANSGAVQKATMVSNVAVERLRLVGANTAADLGRGIELTYVDGFQVKDVEVDAIDAYAVLVDSSVRGEVSGLRIRGVHYDGVTGSAFYAITVLNAAQWVRVIGCHSEKVRHLYVNTSNSAGQSKYGQPRFVTVVGNVAQNMQAGHSGRSWAFEHHGLGDSILIADNVIDGCYGGFVARGPGVRFVNNIIRNWYQYAVQVHVQTVDARYIEISRNLIADRTIEGGGAAAPRAVFLDLTAATTIKGLRVDDNEIEWDLTAQPAIQIVGPAAGAVQSLSVKRNEILVSGTPSVAMISSGVTPLMLRENLVHDSSGLVTELGSIADILTTAKMWLWSWTPGIEIESAVTGTGSFTSPESDAASNAVVQTGTTTGSTVDLRKRGLNSFTAFQGVQRLRWWSMTLRFSTITSLNAMVFWTNENSNGTPSLTARHLGIRRSAADAKTYFSTADGTTEQTTDISTWLAASTGVVVAITFDGVSAVCIIDGVERARHIANVPGTENVEPLFRAHLDNTAAANRLLRLGPQYTLFEAV